MAFTDYLIQKGVLSGDEGEELAKVALDQDKDVIDILVERGKDGKKLLRMKSEYFNIPVRSVVAKEVPLDTLKFIPEESARHYQFVPVAFSDEVLEVGMVDPDDLDARDALQFISSKLNVPFKLFLISRSDFNMLMESYKGLSGEVGKALTQLKSSVEEEEEGSSIPESSDADIVIQKEDIDKNIEPLKKTKGKREISKKGIGKDFKLTIVEDTPVTKIVSVLLRHATEGGASDVHIEPTSKDVVVRFRVDGVLYKSLSLPASVHKSIVARVKVLANLKLDERRKPQDGSFSARIENRKIDFRVSTFPTHYGEKVVLRILDPGKGVKTLEEAGLTGENLKRIREAIKAPFGLILLTGPTGSGKSTTLYAMLKEVDREGKNVVSLEDPIEYNIDGVSQSQVRPEIGYTFANGLRSILRQDPDIIMVGEIRDKETAQLAIQAALTGHLVFSTLHTNSAVGVVPRLVDMGVDPYLISPTLLIVVGQRLVPLICEASKKAVPIEGSIKEMLDKQFEDLPPELLARVPKSKEVYTTIPSPECPGGTKGRIGVFEVMRINKAMEKVILENPTEGAILKVAREDGMFTMKEDALFKSFLGKVPFREVNKFE